MLVQTNLKILSVFPELTMHAVNYFTRENAQVHSQPMSEITETHLYYTKVLLLP